LSVKKILLLIKGLGRGGAEQLLVNAAAHLDRSRFEYEVAYLLPHKDALVADLESAGLPVHCIGGARSLSWIPALRSLVAARGIDLVHVHSPLPAIGARLALSGMPIVCTEHQVWERYHRATYWANLLTFGRNTRVFTVSDEVRRTVRPPRALRWLPMPPTETLYYGLDHSSVEQWRSLDGVRDEFSISQSAPLIGTVGNFKSHKGYGYLLEAASKVLEAFPDARFMLVGQGPMEDEMRRKAKELGLDDAVIFAGFRTDATRLINAFDIFTMASIHEGLSIALLEAMALAKPVVITAAGGNPEAVENGMSGIVVPPRDPDALAEQITRVLGEAKLAERLGGAAEKRSARFDIRTSVRHTEAVYEELLS